MGPLIIAVLIISAVSSFIVFLLSKLKKKIYKYIPAIILFALALSFFIKAKFFSEAWGYLGFILLFIIFIESSLITFVVGFILDKRAKK